MSLILNPNLEERKRIGMEVKNNGGYCPCLLIKNEDTKCPCKDKRENKKCICGLFIEESEV
jgi:ferredoxin-thioredoxin reductase catalytic subunit